MFQIFPFRVGAPMACQRHCKGSRFFVPLFLLSLLLTLSVPSLAQQDRWEELNTRVEKLYQQGKYAEAIPLAQEALRVAETSFGPEDPTTATALNNLAELYYAQGNYAAAEPLYQRALAIREKALGPEHPDVAQSLNDLAGLYRTQGNYAAAEPLFQRSLAIREKALGPEHPAVATSLNNLAVLYQAQGNYAAAEPLYQRSLAIWEKALGPEHPDVARSLNSLALLYQAQGNYAAPIVRTVSNSLKTVQNGAFSCFPDCHEVCTLPIADAANASLKQGFPLEQRCFISNSSPVYFYITDRRSYLQQSCTFPFCTRP